MIIESNNKKTKTIFQVIIVIGSLLVWLTRERLNSPNEKSAFAARTLQPDQIATIHAVRVGRSMKLPSYHLRLDLKDGSHITTGRWGYNENEIATDAQTLARTIGVPKNSPPA